jgi:hypothetical protein
MQLPTSLSALVIPVGCVVGVVLAYRGYGWPGVALAVGALVMWLLLHFTRLLHILKRAADRPIGFVGSAVMLHAKLRRGVTLMHVVALTRALGALQTPKDTQPEVFRWTDASGSSVTCTFVGGKLTRWELQRPEEPTAAP